jgi:DNA-binding LytR/AlgR family response regulator
MSNCYCHPGRAGGTPITLEMLADLAEDFHLLFTDIQMPHMDGCELAEKARTMRPALKIIFTSGVKRPSVPGPFLAKPYERAALADLVSKTMAA